VFFAYREPSVIGLLRFVGLMNAAVWFGAAVFWLLGAGPSARSGDMLALLGAKNFPYYSITIAEILNARYFNLHFVCAAIALLHLAAEWLYIGNAPRRPWLALLASLVIARPDPIQLDRAQGAPLARDRPRCQSRARRARSSVPIFPDLASHFESAKCDPARRAWRLPLACGQSAGPDEVCQRDQIPQLTNEECRQP